MVISIDKGFWKSFTTNWWHLEVLLKGQETTNYHLCSIFLKCSIKDVVNVLYYIDTVISFLFFLSSELEKKRVTKSVTKKYIYYYAK